DEHRRKIEAGSIIFDPRTVKNAGEPWMISGREARAHDILAVHTATNRAEVEDLYALPRGTLRDDPTAGEAPKARLIRIDGPIDTVTEAFVKRQIDRSLGAGANLLIFEIDSYGGLLVPSFEIADYIASLNPKQVRTVAWVPEKAISGAAIIALGCDEVYMQPDAVIGDAMPIEIKPGAQFEKAPEKILSFMEPKMRSLATKKGRSVALMRAMFQPDFEVRRVRHREKGYVRFMSPKEIEAAGGDEIWEDRGQVDETGKGKVLTVNGLVAHDLALAKPPVNDFEDLKSRLGIAPGQNVIVVGRTWVDDLIEWLNTESAMAILITIGLICLFIELHVMTGLLGIVAAVCFVLFFWARVVGGTAEMLEVLLFILGVVCLAIEIFVIPGFGVFGVSGGLLILSSLVLASQTFTNIEPGESMRQLTHTMTALSASMVAVVAIAIVLNRYLPQMPLLGRVMLSPAGAASVQAESGGPRLRPDLASSAGGGHPLVGRRGATVSDLRPAGKIRLGDDFVDVVSDGPYIDKGSTVEIVQVLGNRIVVREV
ncbi:MAG: hypothetical protein KY476_22585, partial [Planctomycetes bacterium]|nr:hypothetical protein [Planctomycetota bacterium]